MAETNTQKLLRAWLTPAQEIEDALQQLYSERFLTNAVGVQLDSLGKLVGEPRDGEADDAIYRKRIRARISTNRSRGSIQEIVDIADLIVNDDDATLELDNQGRAAYVLRVEGVELTWPVADVLIRFLRRATAGGVRPIEEFHLSDPAEAFVIGTLESAGYGTRAELGMSFLGSDWDTVFEARIDGVDGNAITIVADAKGASSIFESGSTVTINFEDGVASVADIEALVDSDSTLIRVKTPGTSQAYVLDESTDETTATALAGGAAGAAGGKIASSLE